MEHVASFAEAAKAVAGTRAERRKQRREQILAGAARKDRKLAVNPFAGNIPDFGSTDDDAAKGAKGGKGKAGAKGSKKKVSAPPKKKQSNKMAALQHNRPGEKPKGFKKWFLELEARGWSEKKTRLVRGALRMRPPHAAPAARLARAFSRRCPLARALERSPTAPCRPRRLVLAVGRPRGLVRVLCGGVRRRAPREADRPVEVEARHVRGAKVLQLLVAARQGRRRAHQGRAGPRRAHHRARARVAPLRPLDGQGPVDPHLPQLQGAAPQAALRQAAARDARHVEGQHRDDDRAAQAAAARAPAARDGARPHARAPHRARRLVRDRPDRHRNRRPPCSLSPRL